MMQKRYRHILKVKQDNPKKELEFEINYQLSLTTKQRFEMMFKKSKQTKEMLVKNGRRKSFEVIKRK